MAIHNPLLRDWDAPYGLPPYAELSAADFEPALESAMAEHRAEIEAIAADPAPPDVDNTAAAFDRAGRRLARIGAAFHGLTASASNPELQAAQRALAAPLAAHDSAIHRHAGVFARLDAVHERRESLAAEPRRLVERLHQDFVRAGARLDAAGQRRCAELMQRHAQLTTRFAQNLLQEESSWVLPLHGEADLAGLPESVREVARTAATERGIEGHAVTLARSHVIPFLTHAARRDLRERVWRAWAGRGEPDNAEIARDILRLRGELARLHGHACYADHALTDTMAGSAAAVQGLLGRVWPLALAAVERERAALLEAMRAQGLRGEVEPWDWRYWAERVRRERYAVDEAEVKPYFQLERVVEAAFDCAQRLFGLRFSARADLPVHHPSVRAYEVRDAAGGVIGVFLHDHLARPGKRSGAWMSSLRLQARNGGRELPIVVNNNNFAAGHPTLLSLDDARTLFHEFGHGLHGLLSDVAYRRLSGTQVLRDFVELPSQLFEHWIAEPEVLRRHARHLDTGEPLPDALIQRLQRARRFGQGYETVRYLASALVDQAVHGRTEAEPPRDLCAFESGLMQRLGLPHGVGMNHRLVHFQHLFSSSAYAAQYYVYLWAEVLDADGNDAFVEAGDAFHAATAARLKRHVYAVGNSVEPGAAYVAFRGRAAQLEPLLRKRGLIEG
ncbi:MAG: M3 family metallopeptidase [Burkholderiales bacterium]|nr:M3 family metallopeptidase [Burkholderiales bacterium]